MKRREHLAIPIILLVAATVGAIVGVIIGVINFKPPRFTEADIEEYRSLAETIYDMSEEEIEEFPDENIDPTKDGYNVTLTIKGKGKITFNFSEDSYSVKYSKMWIANIIADIFLGACLFVVVIVCIATTISFFSKVMNFFKKRRKIS